MAKQYFNLDELVYAEKPIHPNFKDLTGQRFGRLNVLGFAGRIDLHSQWYCKCDCGKVICSSTSNLASKSKSCPQKSCGCFHREQASKANSTHKLTSSNEYDIYYSIKARCENKNHPHYSNYGGRGIRLILTFEEFLAEVGKRPSKKHSIDRIENSKHYQKGNIRWATKVQQANNTRRNLLIYANAKNQTCAEWAKEIGISAKLIQKRKARKWCDHHAVFWPRKKNKPKDCINCNKN